MMTMFLDSLFWSLLWTACMVAGTLFLYRLSEFPARAPGLDIVLSLLTWVPWIAAAWKFGRIGCLGCLAGQFIVLQLFAIIHTLASGYRGPKIRHALDRIVGPFRNHLGLWITIPALPVFVVIRAAELFVYPLLVWVLGFPRYRQCEWVNVSRQKFSGLVGHDLIWCLYCDWMTGVYSLGAEMLRNVESFWCPIRFYEGKKCENCRIDFPDIAEWVEPKGTMRQVEELLEEKYPPGSSEPRRWFGHPERRKK